MMVRGLRLMVAGLFFSLLFACGGAFDSPEDIVVRGWYTDAFSISWKESNAMGLYITEPDASLPKSPTGKVNGKVFWVLEATKFPHGFGSPVSYGHTPKGAREATQKHGGPDGPARLQCDLDYKVGVVALLGSSTVLTKWECQ